MPRSRLDNGIEHITATEYRYLLTDVFEGTARVRSTGDLQPDSPEWFSWLASLPSFHFKGKLGHFTARKDAKKRGHGYWYAYRKHQKKLSIIYLGATEKLTLAHLEAVAATVEQKALHNS